MKYSDIQQRRRRAEKLINRAMNHAREGQHWFCAELMQKASIVLTSIATDIKKGEENVD